MTTYCTHHRCILSALADAARLSKEPLETTVWKMVNAGSVPCRLYPGPLDADGLPPQHSTKEQL